VYDFRTVTLLKDVLIGEGLLAARPAAGAVVAGSLYSATDTGAIYRRDSDGTWHTWRPAAGGASSELGYTQITAPISILSTSEAAGTLIFSPGAITFPGTPVICEVFAHIITPNVLSAAATLSLFEGATQITELAAPFLGQNSGTNQGVFPVSARYRFTPTAGAHTYTVTAFASSVSGTPKVSAGAGGAAGIPPAFLRFITV
jgi:hypothetical protein